MILNMWRNFFNSKTFLSLLGSLPATSGNSLYNIYLLSLLLFSWTRTSTRQRFDILSWTDDLNDLDHNLPSLPMSFGNEPK